MEWFEVLGGTVQHRWSRCDFDERRFSEIACEALVENTPSSHIGLDDVVEHVWKVSDIGHQHAVEFGEPPITVFQTERFIIEVLPWLVGTTAIHQHPFSGAFHVMSGSSLHTSFEFVRERRYSERLTSGDLKLNEAELLQVGAVRPIQSDSRTIHALYHLDRPTVSVVVRTREDACSGPQLRYSFSSGLAWDPFYTPHLLKKRLGLLRLLALTNAPSFEDRVASLIAGADAFSLVQIVLALPEWIQPLSRLDDLVSEVPCRHPELLARLAREMRRRRSEDALLERFQKIESTEHRFFLALLLNVPSRAALLKLVAERFPGTEAEETIVRWLDELGRTQPKPALGIVFDSAALAVVRLMLAGYDEARVIAGLKEEFSASDVDSQTPTIVALQRKLRSIRFLEPLIGEAAT